MSKKDGPFTAGHYTWSGGVAEPDDDSHRDVWFYADRASEEFHLDVYEGKRYIGHLTFRVGTKRATPRRPAPTNAPKARKGGR